MKLRSTARDPVQRRNFTRRECPSRCLCIPKQVNSISAQDDQSATTVAHILRTRVSHLVIPKSPGDLFTSEALIKHNLVSGLEATNDLRCGTLAVVPWPATEGTVARLKTTIDRHAHAPAQVKRERLQERRQERNLQSGGGIPATQQNLHVDTLLG